MGISQIKDFARSGSLKMQNPYFTRLSPCAEFACVARLFHVPAMQALYAHAISFCQQGEQFFGVIPADAGIGDALSVNDGGVLSPFNQMAFHHHAHDVLLAILDLRGDVLGDFHLAFEFFAAVGMAAIHHQLGGQTRLGKLLGGSFNVFAAVIGRAVAPAQNHMAIVVARGVHDGGMPSFGYR